MRNISNHFSRAGGLKYYVLRRSCGGREGSIVQTDNISKHVVPMYLGMQQVKGGRGADLYVLGHCTALGGWLSTGDQKKLVRWTQSQSDNR